MTVQNGVKSPEVGAQIPDEDETAFLSFSGELDLATAGEIRERLAQAEVLDSPRVHVDLRQVTFIDSTTIGVLVAAGKRIRADGGTFSVTCGPGNVRDTLAVSGLLDFFEIGDSL